MVNSTIMHVAPEMHSDWSCVQVVQDEYAEDQTIFRDKKELWSSETVAKIHTLSCQLKHTSRHTKEAAITHVSV